MLPFTTDTVTVVHADTVEDRYHNVTRDWPNATRTTVRGCVQWQSGLEVTDARDQTVTTYKCYLPPSTAVTAQDRLEWGGLTLEVDGEPRPFKGPLPTWDYLQVLAKEVRG